MKELLRNLLSIILMVSVCYLHAYSATKTASHNGNWSSSNTWSPSGVPASGDSVIIPSGKTVTMNNNYSIKAIYIEGNGTLNCSSNKTLTMTGSLTVNGEFKMNSSDISFASGKSFTIGSGGTFTWDPKNNDLSHATLFTNGVENFASSSTLIIKEWYDYSVPIGSVVTGNFGNLTLNSKQGSSIREWDQNNSFSTHQIIGTLTIDEAWIVLDKSGSMSTVSLGNIELLNSNSYLDLHGGTHPGTITVNTTNISVDDGRLSGIYNGNGNINLNVSGNVAITGSGTMAMIYNDGVANVGNGNPNIYVAGNFVQDGGYFYGIYNATTYDAGTATMNVNGNLVFGGKYFMLTYSCHSGSGVTTLKVNGSTQIDFSNSNNIFRISGLSSLSSHYNTEKLLWINNGPVTISGSNSAEFASSSSSGTETDSLRSHLVVSGGEVGFNWPTSSSQAHDTRIHILGDLTVSGGDLVFSYKGASLTAIIEGNATQSGGDWMIKRDTGPAAVTFNGDFTQTNGDLNFHYDNHDYTPDEIAVTVNGDFSQSGGNIEFDNNNDGSSASHTLTLNGANYSLSGHGDITTKNGGSHTVFGYIIFNRAGTITMTRSGNSHSVEQMRQVVRNGCTLDVTNGDLQISSHSHADAEMLKIETGGTLKMHDNTVFGSGSGNDCGVTLEAGALLETSNTHGLYNGSSNACLSSAKGLEYYLDPQSIIEYDGTNNQVITGINQGTATGNSQKYGILKVNFGGNPSNEYAYLNGQSDVYVRQQLQLEAGQLNLNNQPITIENGAANAITRNTGYIKSETNAAQNDGKITWNNISTGTHIFPFGVSASEYIPVTFTVTAGSGNDVSISTRATSGPDNQPWSATSNIATILNNLLGSLFTNQSVTSVIDRWWDVSANGVTADVTVSYRGSENTVTPSQQNGTFGIQSWDGSQWRSMEGSGTGVTNGIGTIFVPGMTHFSPWVAVSSSAPLPIELIFFKAKLNGDRVDLSWATAAEINNDYFTVERSSDGRNFEPIATQPGAGNSTNTLNYSDVDNNPLTGYNYYRLKQTDFDGHYSYSDIETVKFKSGGPGDENALEITSIGPNPFSDYFTVNFMLKQRAPVEIQLMNASGQIVFHDQMNTEDGMNHYDYRDMNGLIKGIYFLNIIYNDQKITQKLIKN